MGTDLLAWQTTNRPTERQTDRETETQTYRMKQVTGLSGGGGMLRTQKPAAAASTAGAVHAASVSAVGLNMNIGTGIKDKPAA